MTEKYHLSQIQLEMIKSGLVTKEEVFGLIDKKREQSRKTRAQISKIMEAQKVSRRQAIQILQKQRRKKRKK